jgi:hypothetical protein
MWVIVVGVITGFPPASSASRRVIRVPALVYLVGA